MSHTSASLTPSAIQVMIFRLSLLYSYTAKQPKTHTQAFTNARKINTVGTVLASKGQVNQ